jgi:hypothetical protein
VVRCGTALAGSSTSTARELFPGSDIHLFTHKEADWLPTLPLIGSSVLGAGVNEMNAIKIAAIVLIVAGALGLASGSFSYTKETHDAKLGPLELSVKEKERVNVPVWAGIGAIVLGGALLLLPSRKSQ